MLHIRVIYQIKLKKKNFCPKNKYFYCAIILHTCLEGRPRHLSTMEIHNIWLSFYIPHKKTFWCFVDLLPCYDMLFCVPMMNRLLGSLFPHFLPVIIHRTQPSLSGARNVIFSSSSTRSPESMSNETT